MTETTIATVEPAAPTPSSAPQSVADATARFEARYSDDFGRGDEGARAAAETLKAGRDREDDRRAVSREFVEEINRAMPEARARQQARADEKEFAQGYERGAKLRDKATWTAREATEVRVGTREWARQLAEEDLKAAILSNREADAEQAQQPQQQPESEAQQRINAHVEAQRWAESDRRFSGAVNQAAAGLRHSYASLKAQAFREFPDVAKAARAGNLEMAVAQLPPQRAARWQQLDAVCHGLEKGWGDLQHQRGRYLHERSGAAAQARQAQFNNWAATQDAELHRKVPELNGPDAKKFLAAAKEVFHEAGLNDQQIRNVLHTPQFRSFPAQFIVCQAARVKLAQRQLAEKQAAAKQRPVPKVMRPGVGGAVGGGSRSLSDLSARVASSKGDKQIRAGAALIAERRRARSN